MRRISAIVEAYGPAVSAVGVFLLLLYFRKEILGLIVDKTISVDNLYTAVFGWAAIQTGCLYAIYGYVAGKTDGFIGEIRFSRSMQLYNSYLKRATSMGFVLTFTSMPLIVWHHEASATDFYWFTSVAVWFSLFVWAFVAFARVAYIFGVLLKVGEPAKVPGG